MNVEQTVDRAMRGVTRRLTSGLSRSYRNAGRRWATRKLDRALPAGAMVQLGSGTNPLPGWVNVDIDRRSHPDVAIDLRWGFPGAPGRVRLVYSEHVLEHLEFDDGQRLLADCRTMLQTDGVCRIAMPDMRTVIDHYLGDWRDQDWLRWPGHEYVDSSVRMVNVAFREWGHRYLYDFAELSLRLREAGFSHIERVAWGESAVAELRGLETRSDSLLIVEARP